MRASIIVAASMMALCAARPQTIVAVSKERAETTEDEFEATEVTSSPIMTSFKVRSDIQFRYANTVVESVLKNPSAEAQSVAFTVVMPEKAFVSNFSMLLGENEYVALVKEKQEAKDIYNSAVDQGFSAGIVDQDTREANKITVSANVGARDKVRFRLTYQELLSRKNGEYEHVIHVNPGQVVKDFQIDVYINESRPLAFVKVPEFRTNPNEIISEYVENPDAVLELNPEDAAKAHISYRPSVESQSSKTEIDGLSGEFIVQYDVDRKSGENDIQVIDGMFVHFFAADNLRTLPKHVIFVLDISGSMFGEKLAQTKDAMVTIIDDMTEKDYFNILTFSDSVQHWSPESEKLLEGPHSMTFPGAQDVKDAALEFVLGLEVLGGTNINDALIEALDLAKHVKTSEVMKGDTQTIIVFLTDGEPTTGVVNNEEIKSNVLTANKELKVPLYSLAFGRGADFNLVKTISVENHAFAKKIYEGSDAAIQLEDFFAEISNPKLTNVKFDYVGELNGSLSEQKMNVFNQGNEFVVAGILDEDHKENFSVTIQGIGADGPYVKKIQICSREMLLPMAKEPQEGEEGDASQESASEEGASEEDQEDPEKDQEEPSQDESRLFDHCIPFPPEQPREPQSESQTFIERLWAYLTIQKLLQEKDLSQDDKGEATDYYMEASLEDYTEAPQDSYDIVTENDLRNESKPETPKEKALKLALRYNFVTPITSLVVIHPDANSTEPPMETVVEIEPLELGIGNCPACYGFQASSSVRMAGPQLMMAAPPGPQRRISMKKTAPGAAGYPQIFSRMPQQQATTTTTTSKSYATTTTHFNMAYDDLAYEDPAMFEEGESSPSPSSKDTPCVGNITLFVKTYLRGDNQTFADSTDDIEAIGQSLTSLAVEGSCCWKLFSLKGQVGNSEVFSKGEYKSASQMKKLFRNAMSIKKLNQC